MSELVGKNGGGGLLIYSVRKSKPIPLDLSWCVLGSLAGRSVCLGDHSFTTSTKSFENVIPCLPLILKRMTDIKAVSLSISAFGVFDPPLNAIVICDGLLSAFFSLSLLAPHSKLIGRHLKSFQALHSDVDCTGRKP